MFSLYRTLSLAFLRRRWSRAALIVASIALGVATLVATQALNESMWRAARAATTPLADTADLLVTNGVPGVRRDLASRVAGVPGVRSVNPLIVEWVLLPDLDNQRALLLGVDLAEQARRPDNPFGVEVHLTNPLALLSGRPVVLLGKDLFERLQFLPTERSTFRVLVAGKVRDLPRHDGTIDAHGPAATLGGQVLFMDAKAVAQLRDKPDVVTRLDVTLDQGADVDQVRQAVVDALGGAAQVRTPQSSDQSIHDVMAGAQIGFALCGMGALVVGLFLVYNALAVSVAERRHEIGILRALGASRGQVWALFVGEAALLGIAGAVLGVPAGRGLAELGLGPLQQILSDLFVALDAREVDTATLTVIEAAAAGFLTAIVAALIPALRAANEEPAAAVRGMPPQPGMGHRLAYLTAVAALLSGGALAIAMREILPLRIGTYGGLLCVLVGLLLATPIPADGLARLIRPVVRQFFGIEARLAADNLVRSPGRTGLVITALAAGVAMMMQTAGVIRSNEDAILAWVDDTFKADLFVTSGSPITGSGSNQPISESLGERLKDLPGVEAALPVRFGPIDFQNNRIFVEAIDAMGFYEADRARGMQLGTEFLPQLADAGTPNVLVSDNFVALHHVHPGETMALPGRSGPVPVRVIGTVVDYSWNRGSIIMDRAQYQRHFGDDLVDVYDVYFRPGTSPELVEETRETIERSTWGVESALVALKRDELRERISGMIRRLYGVAYKQEGVIGVVAALGVIMALLISVLQRRRELGLLRAVGATRSQILGTVVAEAALMGVLGTLIGLAFGVALEWYCVRVILFEEAGFLFPVLIPWDKALWIAAVGVGIATLAGLGPAIRTTRLRIPEAIAYE